MTADAGERFALIGTLFFVLIVELLNTAIEKLADRVTREHRSAHQARQGHGLGRHFAVAGSRRGVTWVYRVLAGAASWF